MPCSMTFQDFLAAKKVQLNKSPRRSVLAIDSSTQMASVALGTEGRLLYSEECFRQKSHSEWINGAVERALGSLHGDWSTLDVLALSNGPGSFTGLRVATNLAKTIAFSKQKPLITYSSLEILAHQAGSASSAPTFIMPVINAFKNMVFMALYQRRSNGVLTQLIAPSAVEIADLKLVVEARLPSSLEFDGRIQVVGDGYTAYKNYLEPGAARPWWRSDAPKDFPLAATLVELVASRWSEQELLHWRQLTPSYLRASAAEENQKARTLS